MNTYTFQLKRKQPLRSLKPILTWETMPSFTKEFPDFERAASFANTIVEELDCEVRIITPEGEKITKDKD